MEQKTATLHENIAIIEVATPNILDSLLADRKTAPLIYTRLDECTAVVAPENFDALLTRLLKLGHLPKVLSR
ncbi:hypothetical protein [Iningainema tapete]|uniref:Uncharacterized protein n=1 Tax=Iningainema tapete BLCC-T55 TaxID=2748662 RepID=A0A8J6XPC5_9CYAN|nr:hypothetical protein [Iningainema tapete]MBD2774052.1 hypothetical protein [Iningainema tapete BLCC-T55]